MNLGTIKDLIPLIAIAVLLCLLSIFNVLIIFNREDKRLQRRFEKLSKKLIKTGGKTLTDGVMTVTKQEDGSIIGSLVSSDKQ